MKDTKTEIKYFNIMQYEQEGQYLRKMHRQGWRFTGISFIFCYHFAKCEPEDVVYQLDYNQEGIGHKAEYVKMFEDCGWEYLMDFLGYSYFRKPVSEMKQEEEIFCDDNSRLEMMQRVLKGRMIPLLVIFFCIIIPQFLNQFSANGITNPITFVFVLLFLLYVGIFINCIVQYWNFKKKLGKW